MCLAKAASLRKAKSSRTREWIIDACCFASRALSFELQSIAPNKCFCHGSFRQNEIEMSENV